MFDFDVAVTITVTGGLLLPRIHHTILSYFLCVLLVVDSSNHRFRFQINLRSQGKCEEQMPEDGKRCVGKREQMQRAQHVVNTRSLHS